MSDDYKQDNDANAYYDDDFIPKIYLFQLKMGIS